MNEKNYDDIHTSNTVILNITDSEITPLETICRVCASQSERIIGIYSEEGLLHELSVKINLYLPVKINEGDTLPLQCCWNCASTILAWHELVVNSIEADRKLRKLQITASKQIIEAVNEKPDELMKAVEKQIDNNDETSISVDHCYSDNSNKKYKYYETADEENSLIRSLGSNIKESRNRRRKADIVYIVFCDICNKGYTRRSDMERHRKSKHPNKCISQNINITTDTEQNETENDYVCRYCNERFGRKIDIKVHAKSEHGITKIRRKNNEITAKYFCDVCQKGFTRKFDMKKHKQIKHPDVVLLEPEKNLQLEYLSQLKVVDPDSRSYYKCDVCEKMFKYTYNLLRHQITHTKAYTYFCHMCAKRFPSSSGLRRHLNEHHYGVKKFSCDICGKKFAANATKEEHMNIHTNNRPFVCDICGKAFKQKASLRSHKLFHSKVCKFSCNFCDKKFRRAYELKTHMWTHTGHRPHQCHLCSSKFRLGQDLKRHLKVHDKLNECVCEECCATFSQQKYLNNHKRSHKGHSKSRIIKSVSIDDFDSQSILLIKEGA